MPRITDTTKHSISMTWTRPMYDGGSDVSGYVVEILEEGTEQWYRATAKALKTNDYVAAGLASNKKYRFRVAAINSKGTGEFSEASAEVEPLEKIGELVQNPKSVNPRAAEVNTRIVAKDTRYCG